MAQDPTSIGRYQVLSLLGRGGMGAVYLVEDPKLKRQLVIKIVHEGGRNYAHALERFQREAEISARLNHPNIITVHDVGEDPVWGPFIAMEYIKGVSLARLIHDQTAPLETLLHVLTQGSRGLMAAALAGIAHRDVKPENILVGTDGRVKLMDFGVARSKESQHLTTVGGIIGTPSYFAPELLQDAEASPVTDCYALAVTAFESYTGVLPFQGDSVASTLLRIVNEPPTIPPGMEPRVRAVFLKAFAKRPRDRFPDVYAFMGALVDATPVTEAARSKMHTAMEGTEVSLPGFGLPGVPVPTPHRTAAPLAPPTAQSSQDPGPYFPLPVPPEAPPAPRQSLELRPRPGNSQMLGLVFAGVGALVMTGAGFVAWRWWRARPVAAAAPTAAQVEGTTPASAAADRAGLAPSPPIVAAGSAAPALPGGSSTPAQTDAAKPTLSQLQQQLKELKERNTREAEQLKQAKGGQRPGPTPALDVPGATAPAGTQIDVAKPQPEIPTPALRPSPQEAAPLVPPRLVMKSAPIFPRRAREMRFEPGKDHAVILRVLVDEQGQAMAVAVLEGVPGVLGFNEEAVAAAKRSIYAPATRGGRPQRGSLELTYLFKRAN